MNKNTENENQKERTPQAGQGTPAKSWGEGFETKRESKRGEGASASRKGAADGLDPEMAMEKIKRAGQNLGEQLETQIHDRPYVVIGAAAGAGFLAGSLLGSRLGQIAIALAGGYVARNLLMSAAGGSGGVQKLVKDGIDKLTQERSSG